MLPTHPITKIVSGGQTGVDRAALDVALALGIECGGWCPAGRRAEDGVVDNRYPLQETPSSDYPQRTEWNIRDSDGTLIITRGELSGGTMLTWQLAERLGKPCYVIDVDRLPVIDGVLHWLADHHIDVLNVAGPRESGSPGIGEITQSILLRVIMPQS